MHKPIPPISFNSTQEINEKLRQITNDLDGGKWVNDRFDTQNKPCRFVRILQRMFTVFGVDMFCHIRVNNVAISIFTTANDHKKYLNAESKQLVDDILTKLDEKTKGKHKGIIQMAKTAMNGLDGKTSQGYAAPAKPGVVPPPPPPQQTPENRPLPPTPQQNQAPKYAQQKVEQQHSDNRVKFEGKLRNLEDNIVFNGCSMKVKDALKLKENMSKLNPSDMLEKGKKLRKTSLPAGADKAK